MLPRVWAPSASLVELVLPSPAGDAEPAAARRVAMAADGGGWWAADVDLPHGTDYAVAVDGGPARPDPRSRWQPAGVHGPSRVFDVGRFAWTDAAWPGVDVRGAVLYELHVGTFTPDGTLTSAIERLDHLVELGVDVVELMPVAAFNGRHGWGYDGVAICAVHQPYGGPEALQSFVDAAHARGLGVCLDVVHNHLGPSGNYLAEFGPYFTDTHTTPWGAAVNLDAQGSAEVRRWICDSALGWLRDFHLDALRLDAVHALRDDSERHLLAQLSDEVAELAAELGRPLALVAESDLNDVVSLTPTADGGWGMTAQWADDVHHAVHALVTGERHGYYCDFGTPEVLAAALRRVFVHDGSFSAFRGAPWGRPVPDGVDGHRFVVFGSDHDQVGNRAAGDRPSASLDDGALAASAALVLLSPFTPMLFMGEEWAASTPWQFFTDHPEPELAEAVRRGRREEFAGHDWPGPDGGPTAVPDPQDPETFRRSRLDWREAGRPEAARMTAWYRRLIALRRQVPDLGCGDRSAVRLRWGPADGHGETGGPADGHGETGGPAGFGGWLVVHRGAARVAVNLAHRGLEIPLDLDGPAEVLAAWTECTLTAPTASGRCLRLGPRSVAVLG